MKKSFLLVAILAIVGAATAVAQPRAIGVNLGYGIDVSYQHALGENNMIDLAVGVIIGASFKAIVDSLLLNYEMG